VLFRALRRLADPVWVIPDLTGPASEIENLKVYSKTASNGGQQTGADRLPGRDSRAHKSGCASLQPKLYAALSASLRVELLREIEALGSADEAALWAKRRLAQSRGLSRAR
jgi:hypothetical protein